MNVPVESARERRQYPRIRLKAYGFEQKAELNHPGGTCIVSVVDISPGGARLGRLEDKEGCAFDVGQTLKLKILVGTGGLIPTDVSCEVRWRGNDEIGVQFHPSLDASVGELQKIFSP